MIMFRNKPNEPQAVAKPQGPFLGTVPNGDKKIPLDVILSNMQRGHVAVIAGPGNYKSTSMPIPSLLNGPGESAIVFDPSGEIYSICEGELRRRGYDVYAMAAYPSKSSRIIGRDIIDVGCEPFIGIDKVPEGELRGEIDKVMRWVIQDEPKEEAKDGFFKDGGRNLGTFLAYRCLVAGDPLSLPNIRKHLMLGPDRLMELYQLCEEKYPDTFGGVFRELAAGFRGVQEKAGAQAMGIFGTAERWFSPFSHGSEMGRHTSASSFDPRVLKDPTKKSVLFIVGTLEHMKTHARVDAMRQNWLFDTIAADEQLGTVTAYVDEASAIPNLNLPDSLLFYRKTGLRCVLIFQDLEAQCLKNFGEAGVKQVLAGCQFQMLSGGCTEPNTLERFSKLCGTQSVQNANLNDRSVLGGPLADLSSGLSHSGVPLLRPEEVQLLGSRKWLLVSGHTPPFVIDKVPYWERPEWLAAAGPSPYYRG